MEGGQIGLQLSYQIFSEVMGHYISGVFGSGGSGAYSCVRR